MLAFEKISCEENMKCIFELFPFKFLFLQLTHFPSYFFLYFFIWLMKHLFFFRRWTTCTNSIASFVELFSWNFGKYTFSNIFFCFDWPKFYNFSISNILNIWSILSFLVFKFDYDFTEITFYFIAISYLYISSNYFFGFSA